jgi:hypothetical protein
MQPRKRRLLRYTMLLLGGAALFGNANAACTRIAGDQALLSLNACFIFDCQDGLFGGLIDPCVAGQELFIDCPGLFP